MAKVAKLKRVWQGMHERCEDQTHKSYAFYGGRGISVCAEWATYPPFKTWAEQNGYREGLKLDRRRNNGPYSPENCRFVTHAENMNNTRRNLYVTAFGETKTISEWMKQFNPGVCRHNVYRRIVGGMPPELALTAGPKVSWKNGQSVEPTYKAFGEEKTLAEWCRDERCKAPYTSVLTRLRTGWSNEEAIATPNKQFQGRQRTSLRIAAFGETKSIPDWARDERCAVPDTTLYMRVFKYGWDAERAILTPTTRVPAGAN